MNKKLFLGMFAAAGMLFATSCSNDELDVVQSGDEAQVTFSLGLEGGIATRAISDGTKADKLVYAVYKLNAQGQPELQNVVGSTNGQFVKTDFKSGDNVSITLAKGQTYQVAFWAQDSDCKAYETNDLTAVQVKYQNEDGTNAANNDELRDAFFKMVEFEVAGNKTIDVVLKRPFAQINVGVDADDWAAAVASGIEIEKSAVVVKNAANTINLLTGAVSGNETVVTYVSDAIPDETLYVETDVTKEGKEAYNWLSMSYILVADVNETDVDNDGTFGDARTTLESLQFTFTPVNGNPIEFKEGLNSVPVQRNWRTNILGKILTGDIQFNITIDPAYEGDIIYPDNEGTFAELELAASMGGTVTLDETFEMPDERPFLRVSADFTLNINENVDFVTGNAGNYGIIVTNGTTTINGEGDIKSEGGGIGITDGASLVFNGGNLDVNTTSTSGRYLFYLVGEGSTATINGGNFDFNKTQNQKRAYIYAEAGTTVYVKGGNFGKASTRSGYTEGILGPGKVVITGGTFGFDPSAWVADGYATIKEGDSYKVVPQIVASLANVTENTTVELKNDVTVSTGTTIQTKNATANITINGNGNSIVSTANSGDDFQWLDNSTTPTMSTILSSSTSQRTTITVNDLNFEGTISALMLGHYYAHNSNNNDIFLNNVNVINTKVVSFSANVAPAVAIYGTATLEDCNIYGTTRSELETSPMWELCDIAVVNDAVLTLKGGKVGKIIAWAKSKITVDNNAVVECIKPISQTMNTDTKYGVTVKAGATVEVLDLSNIALDKKKINITIEEGATVGKIIDANGNEYFTLEAFKNAE